MVFNVYNYSVFTISDVVNVLSAAGKMTSEEVKSVNEYIAKNKFKPEDQIPSAVKPKVKRVSLFSPIMLK